MILIPSSHAVADAPQSPCRGCRPRLVLRCRRRPRLHPVRRFKADSRLERRWERSSSGARCGRCVSRTRARRSPVTPESCSATHHRGGRARGDRRARTGRLRPARTSVGATLVVQAVAAFRRQHPGVHLSLIEAGPDKLVHEVRSGDLDVAAMFDFPALELTVDEGLEARHLLDEPHDLLLPPDHPLAAKRRLKIADLCDEDWLFRPSARTPRLRSSLRQPAQRQATSRIVFRVNDCEMHQALVAAGVGIGFLPRLALHPVHPGVVIKAVEEAPRRRILAIALPGARSAASEVFLRLLADTRRLIRD